MLLLVNQAGSNSAWLAQLTGHWFEAGFVGALKTIRPCEFDCSWWSRLRQLRKPQKWWKTTGLIGLCRLQTTTDSLDSYGGVKRMICSQWAQSFARGRSEQM